MPSGTGWTVGVTDMDLLLKARITSARADTGFFLGSQDFADRYEKSAGSSDRLSTATGMTSGGVDLKDLFMAASFDPYVHITGGNITTLTSPQHLDTGDSLTLAVTATGYGSLSYQWYVNSSPVPGETGTSFVYNATGPSLGDYVEVRVSNDYGWVAAAINIIVDNPATLTVTMTGSTSVPANGSASDGSWAYSASSSDGTLKRYRFYIPGHGAGAWTNTPGLGLTGSDFGVSAGFTWGAPIGSPDIYSSPGGPYDFVFEAEDIHGNSDSQTVSVTVT